MKNNIVISYQNPDTDGVACSIAMAIYMKVCKNKIYKAVICGKISDETRYVLNKLGLDDFIENMNIDNADDIILVDTHHKKQVGSEFPFEKVSIIIDHHPGGDIDSFPNAKIDNRKIGAAASIVGEMYIEKKIIDRKIFQLLQYAIVSNTLNFTAPSTTEFDRIIYKELADKYPIDSNSIREMFNSRKKCKNDMMDIVKSDLKMFETRMGLIAISQIEEFDLSINEEDIKNALNKLSIDSNLVFSAFNGVDIGNNQSLVIFSDNISDEKIMDIFGLDSKEGKCIVDRILLRKTDFIPAILSYDEKLINSDKS